jgi:uncharacterized protein (DUF983 family)
MTENHSMNQDPNPSAWDGRAPESLRRSWPTPPLSAGLAGRCPRCGDGALFSGLLTIRPRCEACGLDYAFADSADGPAVFVMLIAGFIVVGGALFLEAMWEPPFWVHLIVTVPFAALVCLAMLRPMKGLAVYLQYRNKAEEGRLGEGGPQP